MSEETKTVDDNTYAIHGLISCNIQGTAICHLQGRCSVCPIALAHDNPNQPLHFWIAEVNK